MKNDIPLLQRIMPGIIALLILLFLWGDAFFPWFVETFIIYAGSFFLIRVVALSAIERKFERSYIKLIVVGIAAIAIAIYLNKMTPMMAFESLVVAVSIWSLLFTLFSWLREHILKARLF